MAWACKHAFECTQRCANEPSLPIPPCGARGAQGRQHAAPIHIHVPDTCGSALHHHRAAGRTATLRSSACRASHTIHPEHNIFSALHRMARLLVHPTQPNMIRLSGYAVPSPFPPPGYKHCPG